MGKLIPYLADPMQSPCLILYNLHHIQVQENSFIHLLNVILYLILFTETAS